MFERVGEFDKSKGDGEWRSAVVVKGAGALEKPWRMASRSVLAEVGGGAMSSFQVPEEIALNIDCSIDASLREYFKVWFTPVPIILYMRSLGRREAKNYAKHLMTSMPVRLNGN